MHDYDDDFTEFEMRLIGCGLWAIIIGFYGLLVGLVCGLLYAAYRWLL